MRRLKLLAAISAALGAGPASSSPPLPVTALSLEEPAPIVLAPEAVAQPEPVAWTQVLAPLRFEEVRTHTSETVRLYAADGSIDEEAAVAIDRLAAAASGDAVPPPMNRRLLQLVFKAAAHFGATQVDVVSTFRDSARGGSRHRTGEAMDLMFRGVPSAKLAAHLRGYARVGVGVYTNRRTQFVHLDVRDVSYHWADASPPGRVWRESRLTDRGAPARDLAYRPEQDLPE